MAEPQTLTITSSDGHRFNATLYPADDPSAPVLLFQAALGTPARVYGRLGREMVKHGVALCAPDWRGIGSSSVQAGRASDFGYRHLIEMDMPALIDAVKQRLPHSPLWLGGHSLGGQLSLLRAAAHPEGVSGVALIASGSVHLPCFSSKLRLAIRSLVMMSRVLCPLLGYFPGSRVRFGGREAAGLMHDWSHLAVTGNYLIKGSKIDYEKALRALELPVLALTFSGDRWSPELSAKALMAKLPKKTALHWHWGPAETEDQSVDHYSWIKQPHLVTPAVARYIRHSVSASAPIA